LVLPEGYYASPKRIVKALEAMKHQKGMKKGKIVHGTVTG
jgi:hypothetical protein